MYTITTAKTNETFSSIKEALAEIKSLAEMGWEEINIHDAEDETECTLEWVPGFEGYWYDKTNNTHCFWSNAMNGHLDWTI